MEQNEPVSATTVVEIQTGAIEVVPDSPTLGQRPPWWRANLRDLLAWAGIGAGALLAAEVIGLVIYGVAAAS